MCVSVFNVFVVYVINFQIGSIWTIEVVKSTIILSILLMGGRLGWGKFLTPVSSLSPFDLEGSFLAL